MSLLPTGGMFPPGLERILGGVLGGDRGMGGVQNPGGMGGPSWLPQTQGRDPFGMSRPTMGGGIRDLLKDPNFALALLANSRGQSFGQALGNAGLQAGQLRQQGEDDAFKREYMQAQIASMSRGPQRKPIVIAGPDGKPIYVDESEAIGKTPYLAAGDGMGDYQPGDYTPESWAKFAKDKDPSVLVRYTNPRQEFSPSFQNVTRTNPDGSTQQGTFNTRTGEYDWKLAVVPAGTKPRVDAAGAAEGKIEGERAAKSERSYETFRTSITALDKAMGNTATGPFSGRFPAVTSSQQIAEGAEANMAPVLKQLFRESGEGTFTEGDQALLLKMAPNRTDHAEARKAKIAMIDAIVRAKLGMEPDQATPDSQQQTASPPTLDDIRKKYGRR